MNNECVRADCSASRQKYKTILSDPPWDYRNGGNGRARAHYKLMKIDELCAMNVEEHADKDAVLLMWATWPQVEGAMRVGKAWGFEYVTGFPWLKTYDPPFCDLLGETIVKPTYGTGYWVRGCSEPIFIFRRGKAKPPIGSWMGMISERMEHSRKPTPTPNRSPAHIWKCSAVARVLDGTSLGMVASDVALVTGNEVST